MHSTYIVSGGVNPQNVSLLEPDRWRTLFTSSGESYSGAKVDHRTAAGYPPLWRAINLLSNDVAGLPLDVYRRTDGIGREVATTHAAQSLVKRSSSPIMRACVFRKTLMSHALFFGNGFAVIERSQTGRPLALWPLDPQQMMIRFVDDDLWYCTRINGEDHRFPSREILHIKGLAHDGIRGYNIIDVMRNALGVGMAASEFGGRFFGQGSNMSGLLMIPGHFDDEKVRNTMSAWNDMNAGLNNANKVGLLQDGVKFQPLTVNPEQAQFLQTREFEVRATVANIIGVPPHLLGDDTRTSHSSLEQENRSYLQRSLNPWLKEWESECNDKLLSEREKERDTHFFEFNRDAEIQMSFVDKINGIYRQIEMGTLSQNEGRQKMNLPDIGPEGDTYYVPANWVDPTEEPAPQPAEPAVIESDDDEDDPASQNLRQLVTASVEKSLKIEKDRVERASKTSDNFLSWVDTFYETWADNVLQGIDSRAVDQVKHSYAQDSKAQILDVSGASTVASLPGNIKDMTAQWSDRGNALIDSILKAMS